MTDTDDTRRRLYPRLWDHDYMLMRRLASALRSLIKLHLAARVGLTIVDYGCGPMPYRALFQGFIGRYLGVDLPDNPVADVHMDAQARLPLADNSVDVVLSSQVLEHVLDVDGYLGECRRVLRQDGLLLLSTHGSWFYHPQPTDVRRWTRWGLVYDIERNGFAVQDCEPCIGPLAYTTQMRLVFVTGFLAKFGVVGRIVTAPIAVFCQGIMWLGDQITPESLTRENACVYVIAARPK